MKETQAPAHNLPLNKGENGIAELSKALESEPLPEKPDIANTISAFLHFPSFLLRVLQVGALVVASLARTMCWSRFGNFRGRASFDETAGTKLESTLSANTFSLPIHF